MRRFYLQRDIDELGVSGAGLVAEGIEFDTGITVLLWLTEHSSVTMYSTFDDVLAVHGHQGRTVPLWLDDPDLLPLAVIQRRATTLALRAGQALLASYGAGIVKASATQAMADWKARAKAERQAARVFGSTYAAQQQAILRELKGMGAQDTSAAYAALLDPAFDDTRDTALLTTLPFYDSLLRQAVQEGIAHTNVGIDWEQANQTVLDLAHAKAEKFSAEMTDTSKAQTYGIIEQWIKDGGTMPDLIDRLDSVWTGPRPDVAAVTEVTDVFSAGNILAWQESRVVHEYRFRTAHDDRVCPYCEPLDNQTFDLDDEEHRPPIHAKCLPGNTRVVAGGILAVSKRWYDGDLIILRSASGHRLACTPNHPILTPRGWIAAHLLDVGSHIISSDRREWKSFGDVDREHMPARIEQIAEAFGRSAHVFPRPVKISSPDFHGDGEGSQVAIIWADGLLGNDFNTTLCEHHCQQALRVGNMQTFLLDSQGMFDFGRKRPAPSACGAMGGGDLCGALGFAHATPLENFRFALIANGNAPADQMPSDNSASHTQAYGDGVFRFARLVPIYNFSQGENESRLGPSASPAQNMHASLPESFDDNLSGDFKFTPNVGAGSSGGIFADEIVSIEHDLFHGFVYNLQTETEMYVAEGIVTHNCRCIITPVVEAP